MPIDPEKIDSYLAQLRAAGYKVTNARRVVLEAIIELGGHVISAEVIDAVAAKDASVGRASVFRTLDLLTQLSIIRPTYIDTSATPQYVMMPNGHHHHVICTNCARVIEFEDCGLSTLQKRLETELKLKITGHLLEFYALCKECMSNQAGTRPDE